eukprot:CAMPEP_0176101138 /NCGR_PEP_ID=MMETSP0120_2-20121206/50730_1 /TAXON_ID=160619 /ORGANISM="Kryptoperidinium foliaceum, Strain CCMP 1326" /LENGTH=34 /DNA_ID=CAMNT_0017435193 /DNA_START=492 /DNA_END=593 /DNA_ORIENTATION=+
MKWCCVMASSIAPRLRGPTGRHKRGEAAPMPDAT